MKKKIFVVGAGGRTGTMFAEELKNACDVIGVARDAQADAIEAKKVFVKKDGTVAPLEIDVVREWEFASVSKDAAADYLFLATKNPVGPAVRQYYENFRNAEKIPALVLSQNGLSAGDDARAALREVFGGEAKQAQVIRVSLFNPIDADAAGGQFSISYRLPIRLCYGVINGSEDAAGLRAIFGAAGIDAEQVRQRDTRNMEYSKLFLNLIGMAMASKGRPVKDAFDDLDAFALEINALKEYIGLVRASGGRFLNFGNYPYPVGVVAWMIAVTPVSLLSRFSGLFAKMVAKGRNDKPKDLDEIDYYSGEVVRLADKLGRPASVNEKIIADAKKILARRETR